MHWSPRWITDRRISLYANSGTFTLTHLLTCQLMCPNQINQKIKINKEQSVKLEVIKINAIKTELIEHSKTHTSHSTAKLQTYCTEVFCQPVRFVTGDSLTSLESHV